MLTANGPGRSGQRRSEGDPGHVGYVTPPYTIRWPAPARQTNEPARSPPRSSSVERTGDAFTVTVGSPPARDSPSTATPPTPVSARTPSPRHPRSASRQGSRAPLIKDAPQPPRTALNVSSTVTASQPYPVSSVHLLHPPLSGMHRQPSHHAHPQSPANVYQGQSTSSTHLLNHHHHHSHSTSHYHHPPPITTHHVSHPPRSHSRPPSAASHRYASNITPSMYGHGGSGASNGSGTSLTGGVPPLKDHNASSPPPGMSSLSYYYVGTMQNQITSGSPQRSRSRTRAPPPSPTQTTTPPPHHAHKLEEPPKQQRMAKELRRHARRPALPPNYDGQMETRYVIMLLAMDDIPGFYNFLAGFFTWIMLAGFVLLPATFASLKTQSASAPLGVIARLINNNGLLIIASSCTFIGLVGMIWLWWRWRGNYVWVTQYIFIPGTLNSIAGVISTLANVYTKQGGAFGETSLSAIIATGSLALICGTLAVVYEYGFLRKLKMEHDEEVGVELAGKHGEGITADIMNEQNGQA